MVTVVNWEGNIMCSETSSPRISFSHDLICGDGGCLPKEQYVAGTDDDDYKRRDLTLLDSNIEFEFSIISSIEHESSSADELFRNGKILPIKIQDKFFSHKPPLTATASKLPPLPPTGFTENSKQPSMGNSDPNFEQMKTTASNSNYSKSFWGFKRSNSLNFESKRASSLCPLPLLSRSNSTGSDHNSKSKKFKDSQKLTSQKQRPTSMVKSTSSTSSLYHHHHHHQYLANQKGQLRINPGGQYGNYHCISPVLNVPPAKLFGFGSLLRYGKDKKGKK